MNSMSVTIATGALAFTMAVAPSSTGRPMCTSLESGCASHLVQGQQQADDDNGWPYAVPLDALGGRTLAQYLDEHNEIRLARVG
jgi:hypothetical protein